MRKNLFLASIFMLASTAFIFSCSKKTVDPSPTVSVDTTSINLGTIKSIDTSIVRTISIAMTGTQPVTWSAVSSQKWMTVNPASNSVLSSGSYVNPVIKTAGLLPGSYEGNITVSSKINGTAQTDKVIKVKFVMDVPRVIDGYTLTASETWSGNIYLRGDIVIPSAYTLTIDAGTNIKIASSHLKYDQSYTKRMVDFIVNGNLNVNGVKGKPVQFFSEDNSTDNSLWTGIVFLGKSLTMNYTSVINGNDGLYYSPLSSNNITTLSNCYFGNNYTGIDNESSGTTTLNYTNITFDGNDSGVKNYGGACKDNASNCDFKNNTTYDYYLITTGGTLNISNSNFDNATDNVWISSGCTKSTINLKNNYGINLFDNSKGVNTISQTMATAANSNVGCSFTPNFVSMSITNSNKDAKMSLKSQSPSSKGLEQNRQKKYIKSI